MDVSPSAYETATRRGARNQVEYGATAAWYDRAVNQVKLSLAAGKELRFSPKAIRDLQTATIDQLQNVELGAAGMSVYFPDIDVDVSVPELIHSVDGRRVFLVTL